MMENASNRKWTSRVMLLCGVMIFTLCVAGFLRHLAGELFVRQLGIDNAIVRATLVDVDNHLKTYRHKHQKDKTDNQSNAKKVNLEELYPFPAGESKKTSVQSKNFSLSKWNLRTKKSLSKKGDSICKFTPFAQDFINLNKKYNLLLGWNIAVPKAYNSVIEMPDCKNYWVTIHAKDADMMTTHAEVLAEFDSYLKVQGIPLIYVQQPSKVSRRWDKNIDNVIDFKNENYDIFLEELKKYNLRVIDLRDEFDSFSREEYHSFFFNTDHHWRQEGSRQAALFLFNELNKHDGFNVDTSILDEENFTKEIFEASYLGSQGRKVTLARANPDDVSIYHPKNQYHIHYEVPDAGVNLDGSVEVMYDMSEAKTNFYDESYYKVYNYGNRALNRVINLDANDNHHLLVIHDSFTGPESIFMALCVKKIDFIDSRSFDGSIRTFIEKEKPDTVIVQFFAVDDKNLFSLK